MPSQFPTVHPANMADIVRLLIEVLSAGIRSRSRCQWPSSNRTLPASMRRGDVVTLPVVIL